MTDPRIDGWYRAVGARATFAFRVEDGEVVECAPYGRKIIMGLQWGTATMKLEAGGFAIERFAPDPLAAAQRAERFGYLLSEIEISASQILEGVEPDILAALAVMQVSLTEAWGLFGEISREALDQVTRD